jgi:pimeloyl-ACP methyl ester carboxylesterase
MIAYAYAQAYRDDVSHLVVVDAPLPGTAAFDRLRSDPRVWHFAFHGARDVAEMLVAGRERQYLQALFNARVFDPSAIGDADLEIYVSAYSAPGGMPPRARNRPLDRGRESGRVRKRRAGVRRGGRERLNGGARNRRLVREMAWSLEGHCNCGSTVVATRLVELEER